VLVKTSICKNCHFVIALSAQYRTDYMYELSTLRQRWDSTNVRRKWCARSSPGEHNKDSMQQVRVYEANSGSFDPDFASDRR